MKQPVFNPAASSRAFCISGRSHQRLGPGDENAPRLEGVFVVQRYLGQLRHDVSSPDPVRLCFRLQIFMLKTWCRTLSRSINRLALLTYFGKLLRLPRSPESRPGETHSKGPAMKLSDRDIQARLDAGSIRDRSGGRDAFGAGLHRSDVGRPVSVFQARADLGDRRRPGARRRRPHGTLHGTRGRHFHPAAQGLRAGRDEGAGEAAPRISWAGWTGGPAWRGSG
jgi:hypothetical protein